MARTLQNLLDRLRVASGDKTSVQWSDADIARWATDGQLKILRYTETSKQILTITGGSVSGQAAYLVDRGFLWVEAVYYNGAALSRLTQPELDDLDLNRLVSPTTSIATPLYYWLTKDTINLYPTPDTSGLVIQLICVPRPTDLTVGTDVLLIQDEQFETLVRYCIQMAKESDEDWTAASYYRQDVKERLAEDAYEEAHAGSAQFISVRTLVGDDG